MQAGKFHSCVVQSKYGISTRAHHDVTCFQSTVVATPVFPLQSPLTS